MQAFSRRFLTADFPSPILRPLTVLLSDLQTSLTSQLEKSPGPPGTPQPSICRICVRKPDNREVSEAPEIRENDLRVRSERSRGQRGG
ncbi:hypothetical protein RCIA182 [Methanocella arvoryzae MRE50]|uniref:Uncharacterized protein n=1 Tax=Methanocella arvoryzae (strain DSM 22066 / NBRC 105507 / MRE50) TaxID=351160 RepID=Q0W267_METAR|nr:hypothetical protein RCIA182 [Methanocella arvoryzae MRE50]